MTNNSEISFESSRVKRSPFQPYNQPNTILKSHYFHQPGSNTKTTERDRISAYHNSQPYLNSVLSPLRNNSQLEPIQQKDEQKFN